MTGELKLFLSMWKNGIRRSEVSNILLPEFSVCLFCHILGKQAYPEFRLRTDNIVIVTYEEHILWEHHKRKIAGDPLWQWVFDLEERNRRLYHAKN
jgi:hypothetical protein